MSQLPGVYVPEISTVKVWSDVSYQVCMYRKSLQSRYGVMSQLPGVYVPEISTVKVWSDVTVTRCVCTGNLYSQGME